MSIQNTVTKCQYVGNGNTTVFPYTFTLSPKHPEYVVVYITGVDGNTATTNNVTIDTAAQSVTYPADGSAPLAVGEKITIARFVPYKQILNLVNQGPFFAEDIETELDEIVSMIQQIAEAGARSLKTSISESDAVDWTLPAAKPGWIFCWNEEGTGLINVDIQSYVDEANAAVEEAKAHAEEATAQKESAEGFAEQAAESATESENAAALVGTRPLKQSFPYAEGDVAFHPDLPSWAYLAVKTAGVTGPMAPTFTGTEEAGDIISDGTVEWEVKDIKAGEGGLGVWEIAGDNAIIPKDLSAPPTGAGATLGTPENKVEAIYAKEVHADIVTGGGTKSLGDIVWRSIYNPQVVGEILANGAEVSRAMYPQYNALCAEQGYPWGDGDGSTTFNLPDLIGKFPEGAETAGGYHEAGLPNIEGSISEVARYTYPSEFGEGAISAETIATGILGGGNGQASGTKITFNASNSTSIYGNSTTVQPDSALLLPYVVVFNDTTADSALVDMTQIAQDLAGKANRDLSNLSPAGEARLNGGGGGSFDWDENFTIIYPNGGSASSPANITGNTRYVLPNPFPSFHVYCVAELLVDNKWGSTGWYTSTSYVDGTRAMQYGTDEIIVQTGSRGVTQTAMYGGNPFKSLGDYITTAPCRVKVWKVGKI